ncbi:MAG: type II 3-dehydroquinate dehydratase [Gammaproteobacteria bacterium]|nr:type II 3-dehydroquinate dehydratase [Gammaproteobacteria bacterium]
MATIQLIHGPNLNLLGSREPVIYGHTGLAEIEQRCSTAATARGFKLQSMQSNAEHELIEAVQQTAATDVGFIVINPAAFTHTSVALRDALAAVGLPFIEVHLSNVFAREPFRAESYFSDLAVGVISGLGHQGYEYAVEWAAQYLVAAERDN